MFARLLQSGLIALASSLAVLPAAADAVFKPGRGVSMDQWVTWPAPDTWNDPVVFGAYPEWMNFVSDEELASMRAAGIDTIRMPIEPAFLMHNDDPERLGVIMAGIKTAIDRLLAEDFKVILDMHTIPRDQPGVAGVDQIVRDRDTFERYAETLEFIAAGLWQYPVDQLAIEVMNEPPHNCEDVVDQSHWQSMAVRLYSIVQVASPDRHVVMTGACLGSAVGLSKMDTGVIDENVIWTFHFYEPFAVTHQGATWTGDMTKHLRDIPYPPFLFGARGIDQIIAFNEAEIMRNADPANQSEAIGMLRGNLQSTANQEQLDAVLRAPFETVAAWADANGIDRSNIFLGEFGMIGREWETDLNVPTEWRINYMRDVIMIAEEYGFGWSVWSFGGAFGLMQGFGGERLDPTLVPDIMPPDGN
ncbi:MAG: cellulase family glycosylhydrolase [Pseudomonadota bacterium]